MVNVAIIGATGYTGADAIRLLLSHQEAELVYLSALAEECGKVEKVFEQFRRRCSLEIEPLDIDKAGGLADVVLCCLPHKVSMGFVPKLLEAGLKVVDFSADYRLKDLDVYERYYKVEHTDAENVKRAVYGLPELFRDQISGKDLVANPGCYPTGALLGLAPVLKEDLVERGDIVVNAVTGITGAGKNPTGKFHFPNMNENFFAYGVGSHRHMPEMEQVASEVAGGGVAVLFQPHAGPFNRGILSTIYCEPKAKVDSARLSELYRDFYDSERFLQVCDNVPAVKNVAGTNYCHVYATVVKGKVVTFSAIDNLVKGASGQAIQNMNIIFGLEETLGLK